MNINLLVRERIILDIQVLDGYGFAWDIRSSFSGNDQIPLLIGSTEWTYALLRWLRVFEKGNISYW